MSVGEVQNIFRVGGGYTSFRYNNQTLLYVDQLREIAPRPVASPQPVQPMDSPYPIEIAFPAALEAGSLEITIREQWTQEIWQTLPGYQNTIDLLGVFQQNLISGAVTCMKVINGPSGIRTVYYLGCNIVNITVDETVNIGTMTLPKQITLMYLQRTASK